MGRRTRREPAEGAPAARHAVLPPARPEPYRSGESVRGGSAWRPNGSCMAGRRDDAPLTGTGIDGRGASSAGERRPYP